MHYYEKGKRLNFKKYFKATGVLVIILGAAVFLYFFFPLISYQLFLASAYERSIEVPIPKYLVVSKTADIGSLVSSGLASLITNFNDARNWYPQISQESTRKKVD